MPETSIVVTLNDRYSETAKKLSQVTKAFSKDAEGLEQRLYTLNKNKYTLKLDAQKARQELKETEKQFAATGKEADGLKMELAQANYDNIVRNLKAVTSAAGDTERAISKTMNRASGSNNAKSSILTAIAASGASKMLGDAALNVGNALIGSAFGSEIGSLASSTLSSIASGTTLGSAVAPGIGTAIGAAVGAGVGLLNGATQAFGQRDDAFKNYVQEAYEGQMSAQETSLTSGSALAAQRETDRISFETLFHQGGVEDMGIVETYLSNLVEMANNTPFLYGDLTAMSKTLATYGYSAQVNQAKTLSVPLCNIRHRLNKKVPAHQYISVPFRQRPHEAADALPQLFCLVCGLHICSAAKTFPEFFQNKADFTAAPFFRVSRVEAVKGEIAGDLCQEEPEHLRLLRRHHISGPEPCVIDTFLGILGVVQNIIHYREAVDAISL